MPSAVVSLLINSTQEADSGRFLVQVIIPGDDDLTAELRLNVVGEDTPLGHVLGGTHHSQAASSHIVRPLLLLSEETQS